MQAPKLSVIIPVREHEPNLRSLIKEIDSQLKTSKIPFEIIVSISSQYDADEETFDFEKSESLKFFRSPTLGRSYQLNFAVEHSDGEWLFFLHADSLLEENSVREIIELLSSKEPASQALHYFWLKFNSDGPQFCALNAVFANLRSKFFNLPFGDQGFLLTRKTFLKVGPFPNQFESGEDHAFIQRAKAKGVAIRALKASIKTSARKYKKGWLGVTIQHLYLTAKQELFRETAAYDS